MRFSRFIPVAFAAVAALPAVLTAQVNITNLTPKNATAIIGGGGNPFAYVGPYQAQYAGAPASAAFDVFCIDEDNPFGMNQTYSAYVLTFDQAVSSVLTNGTGGRTNLAALVRILGNGGMANFGGNNTTSSDFLTDLKTQSVLAKSFGNTPNSDWDEIHYAMWAMFTSGQSIAPTSIPLAESKFTAAAATAAAPGYNYADWRIIIDARAWDPNYTSNEFHQALITNVVPEPSTYALMGLGLIAVYGAARRRNRAVKA